METGHESKQSIFPSADLEAWKQITVSFSIMLGCYLSCFRGRLTSCMFSLYCRLSIVSCMFVIIREQSAV